MRWDSRVEPGSWLHAWGEAPRPPMWLGSQQGLCGVPGAYLGGAATGAQPVHVSTSPASTLSPDLRSHTAPSHVHCPPSTPRLWQSLFCC